MPAHPADTDFWAALDTLVQTSRIVIDRPRGSAHPRYPATIYPLDYGYLDGTTAADGHGIDIWRGSLPEERTTAIICCIDLIKRDSENKLLLGCTNDEIEMVLAFHAQGEMNALAIRREGARP